MGNKMKYGVLCAVGGLIIGLFLVSESKGYGLDQSVSHIPSQHAVIATLIAGLKARESSVTTGTGYTTNETYMNPDPKLRAANANAPEMLQVYDTMPNLVLEFWAADGQKTRSDRINLLPRNNSFLQMDAYDGARVEEWSPEFYRTASLFEGTDKRRIAASPTELQLGIGKNPWRLSQILESRNLNFLGKEAVGGVEAYKVQAGPTTRYPETDLYWIAPDEGYLLVKREWRPVALNDPLIVSGRNFFVVDKAVQIGGIWVPQSGRIVGFITPSGKGQREIWESVQRMLAQSIHLNESVSPGMFDLPLPLQTWVRPGDKGSGLKDYHVGGDYTADERRVSSSNVTSADLRESPQ